MVRKNRRQSSCEPRLIFAGDSDKEYMIHLTGSTVILVRHSTC
jgi:hypothetical protein